MTERQTCRDCGAAFDPENSEYVLCVTCGVHSFVATSAYLAEQCEDVEDLLPHLDSIRCGTIELVDDNAQDAEAIVDQYRQTVVEMCEDGGGYEQDDSDVWLFRPSMVPGAMTEHELRFIADELQRRNAGIVIDMPVSGPAGCYQ